MNECYIAPTGGLAGAVAAQRFSGDGQCANMAPKPLGLTAAIQSLTAEVHGAAILAENIANSLGLSTPQPDTEKSSAQAPIELLFDAVRVIRAANAKLTDVLKHINS